MKVLLYTEGKKSISKSGLGKAIKHQMRALELAGVEYTTNPKDDFDIFMSIVGSREIVKYKESVFMLLTLLFPNYARKSQLFPPYREKTHSISK